MADFDYQRYKSVSERMDQHGVIIAQITRDILTHIGGENIPAEDALRSLERLLSSGFKRVFSAQEQSLSEVAAEIAAAVDSRQRFNDGQLAATETFLAAAPLRNAAIPPAVAPVPSVQGPPQPPSQDAHPFIPPPVMPQPGEDEYNVWAFTEAAAPPGWRFFACIIRPVSDRPEQQEAVVGTWRIVAGPMSFQECQRWINDNCIPVDAAQVEQPAPQPPPPLPAEPLPAPPPPPAPKPPGGGSCIVAGNDLSWIRVDKLDATLTLLGISADVGLSKVLTGADEAVVQSAICRLINGE